MAWILRTAPGPNPELRCTQLWDAGTSGIAEVVEDGVAFILAGFESRASAEEAQQVHGGAIEPINTTWTNAGETSVHVGQRELLIASGQAFGHGSHPTTALMLDAAQHVLSPGMRVLDFGTGTGVLAMAAKVLGARDVVALDNSAAALEVAAANAATNRLDVQVTDSLASVGSGFDVILANVLLPVHEEVAETLIEQLNADGQILTAGINSGQRRRLEMAYAPLPVVRDWIFGNGTEQPDWIAVLLGTAGTQS